MGVLDGAIIPIRSVMGVVTGSDRDKSQYGAGLLDGGLWPSPRRIPFFNMGSIKRIQIQIFGMAWFGVKSSKNLGSIKNLKTGFG